MNCPKCGSEMGEKSCNHKGDWLERYCYRCPGYASCLKILQNKYKPLSAEVERPCPKCGSEERKSQLRAILETPVNRPFSEIHAEIEEIMGRPVWTHELALPQELYDELDGKPVHGLLEKVLVIRESKPEGEKR